MEVCLCLKCRRPETQQTSDRAELQSCLAPSWGKVFDCIENFVKIEIFKYLTRWPPPDVGGLDPL